ncbi:HEPN domain-containing protein [Geodermatophilus sp. SYSU D00758]
MSDFPKLQHEAGSYPCTILHPNGHHLPGQLELAAEQRPTAEVFGWPYEVAQEMRFPQPTEKHPALLCELRNGPVVLLVDTSVTSWWPGRATLHASTAVVGFDLTSDPQSTFHEASLQITNAQRVFGPIPITSMRTPRSRPDGGDVEVAATISVDANRVYEHGGTKLRCRYWWSIRNLDYFQFGIRTAPVFEVRDGEALTAAEWVTRHVLPLRELVTLATLENQSIAWLTLDQDAAVPGRGSRENQVFARDILQAPFAPQRDMENDGKSLFVLSDLPYNPVELLQRWEGLRQTHRSFIQPLMHGVTERMDLRARFLSLVQALEGLHTQIAGEGPVSVAEHQQKRKHILAEIKARGLGRDGRAFLNRWLDRFGRYSLSERLQQLRDTVSEDIADLVDLDLVPGKVPEYRNKLSHGAEDYSWEVLRPPTRALTIIGVAHVLRMLDLPLDRLPRLFQ